MSWQWKNEKQIPLLARRVLQNYGIAGSVLTVAALYERRFFAESTKHTFRRTDHPGAVAPPLLCEEGNVSERESSNDLAGSRLCTTVERSAWRIAAVDPIDIAVSGCQASVLVGRRRSRIRPGERYTERAATDRNRAGQEQPVKDVLEVGANLQFDVSLPFHNKVTAQAERFRRSALPSIVGVVRRRSPELSRR